MIWSDRIDRVAAREYETPCRAYEAVAYAKYQERFPEFIKLAELPAMREAWLMASIANDLFTGCYFRNLADDVAGARPLFLEYHLGIVFCGNFSRPPEDVREERAIRSFLLLMQLANSGDFRAVDRLIAMENRLAPMLRFDPVFRHYFLALREMLRGDSSSGYWGMSWKESKALLDADTRRTVEKAARKRDLAGILASLPPCEPIPPMEALP